MGIKHSSLLLRANESQLHYLKNLKFLSESSLYFLGNSSYEEIFPYLAERLHALTDATVFVSEYLVDINSTVVRSLYMNKTDLIKTRKILGKKLSGLTLKFDEKIRKKFVFGRLQELKGGLYELSFYRIPKRLCTILEKQLKIKKIYAMSFLVEKDFLGTAVLIIRNDIVLQDVEIIEAFINQGALALQRKRTEKELLLARERLEQEKARLQDLEQKKDEFIGIASHELRTPLTSVKIYAQILSRELSKVKDIQNRKVMRYLTSLINELDKIEKLVSDMLDVSKIEKGKMIFNMKKTDIDKFIRDTIENFRLMSQAKVIIKGKLKSKVMVDPDRLQQVILNLLNNAVKYSPDSNKVIVKMWTLNNEIKISVEDFGVGIPKGLEEKIFERYFSVNGTNSQGGFGLGLYIASEIVKRHGGTIKAKNKKTKGSIFTIALPLKKKIGYLN